VQSFSVFIHTILVMTVHGPDYGHGSKQNTGDVSEDELRFIERWVQGSESPDVSVRLKCFRGKRVSHRESG